MTPRRYVFLFLMGFGVVCLAATFQKSTGYMDADYYLLGGLQLVGGEGFTEPVLWNYLDDPIGVPHPSHAYWMPFASLLSAIGIRLMPFDVLSGGRIIFLLLAGIIPPVTAWLAWGLVPDRSEQVRERIATLSGMIAVFSGFYLSFLTVPDAFAVYMILGALFLGVVGSRGEWRGKWMVLGVLAGLMHMNRTDGMLWLGIGWIAASMQYRIRSKQWILGIGLAAGGYLLVMGPWLLRNLSVFGVPLAPGGARVLWVLNYDELFSYPGSILTFERWWSAGVGEILSGRLWSLGLNLQTLLGVQGQVFLLPLILLGLWRLQDQRAVRIGGLAWMVTFGVMTLAFPFVGARGGFFHSGAAVQPLFWAVVPVGLEAFVEWGGRLRGWRVRQAQKVFGLGLVGLSALLTGIIYWIRVLPGDKGLSYRDVELKLVELGSQPGEIVMVNNPPGYFLASGRPAVVIPNGDEAVLRTAARHYMVRYVVLDENAPIGLQMMYKNPSDTTGFVYLGGLEEFQMFEVVH